MFRPMSFLERSFPAILAAVVIFLFYAPDILADALRYINVDILSKNPSH